jgi:hypothetical protein
VIGRTDMTDLYVVIRLWCTKRALGDTERAYFVRRILPEGGEERWTVTQTFAEAMCFENEKLAKQVIETVGRIKHRVENGWLYEIIKITEEVVTKTSVTMAGIAIARRATPSKRYWRNSGMV